MTFQSNIVRGLPEETPNALRWIPEAMAQIFIDRCGNPHVFETDDLKLWHVHLEANGLRIRATVVISSQGATVSVPLPLATMLDDAIECEKIMGPEVQMQSSLVH